MRKFVAAAAFYIAAMASHAQANPDTQAADLFGKDARVRTGELAAITGRADTAMEIRANNSSTVSHNSVSGTSQTGTISFDSAAFSSLNGLALLSANTGNNVAINSSLNVNVAIQR